MLRLLILATILLYHPVSLFAQPVNVLVVALHGVETAHKEWQPTIDYLNAGLPQYRFTLIPVVPGELDRIKSLIERNLIDFVITQPAIYVDLELIFGISKILTMVRQGGHTSFGSTIITRSDSGIETLQELHGKRIAGVAPLGFGGWLVGYREMLDQGFDPYSDAAEVRFLGTQPAEIQALLDGEVDAAVVRTGVLEKLAQAGQISPGRLRVLAPKHHAGFPLAVSTALYPEWAFAKTRKANHQLAKEVALQLLSLRPTSPEAQAAGIQEWTFPDDYQSVHDLLKSLRVEPYADSAGAGLQQLFQAHWQGMAILIALVLAGFLFFLIWNRRLQQEILARERVERSLRENEEQLTLAASVFSHAREAILITDPQGIILNVNQAFSEITGYGRSEIIGNKPNILKSGRQSREFYRQMWASLIASGYWMGELWNRRKNGSVYPENLTISAVRDDAGDLQHYIALFTDITEKKQAEMRLQASEKRFRALFDAGDDAIFVIRIDPESGAPVGTFLEVNASACRRLGYTKAELLRLTPADIDAPETPTVDERSTRFDQHLSVTFERIHLTSSGERIPVEIKARMFDLDGQIHMLAIARDLSERKRTEQALEASNRALKKEKQRAEELARTDPLTGLRNRRAFFELGAQIEEQARRYDRPYSVIMLDIDRFKQINDEHGHVVGDYALVALAEAVNRIIRTADVCARMGGEEFAIILPETSVDKAMAMAERLRTALAGIRIESAGRGVSFTASLGVAEFGRDGLDLEAVLRYADEAMYRSKRRGRDRTTHR